MEFLSGTEPPEVRSMGPAQYDPRPGTQYVKHRTCDLGGDVGKNKRSPLLAEPGTVAGYIYRARDQSEGAWTMNL